VLLLVGLGNPGSDYAGHRHNLGFVVLAAIARKFGFAAAKRRFHGQVAEGEIGTRKVLALRPLTYMNDSGIAVGEAVRFYHLEPNEIVVFHDELDLEPGKVRVKHGGGAGGHNGLRSVDAHIGPHYRRVRLGIGHPGDKARVHGYVLSNVAKDEQPAIQAMIDAVVDCAELLIAGEDEKFQTRVALLTRPPRPKKPKEDKAN
jgi:PTH1 family peptidyl-tRNA hydrolase